MSHVARSVCLSVCCMYTDVPCKNGWTDRDTVCGTDSVGPKEPCIRWEVKIAQFIRNRKGWQFCDAAFCEITLDTYYYYYYYAYYSTHESASFFIRIVLLGEEENSCIDQLWGAGCPREGSSSNWLMMIWTMDALHGSERQRSVLLAGTESFDTKALCTSESWLQDMIP